MVLFFPTAPVEHLSDSAISFSTPPLSYLCFLPCNLSVFGVVGGLVVPHVEKRINLSQGAEDSLPLLPRRRLMKAEKMLVLPAPSRSYFFISLCLALVTTLLSNSVIKCWGYTEAAYSFAVYINYKKTFTISSTAGGE